MRRDPGVYLQHLHGRRPVLKGPFLDTSLSPASLSGGGEQNGSQAQESNKTMGLPCPQAASSGAFPAYGTPNSLKTISRCKDHTSPSERSHPCSAASNLRSLDLNGPDASSIVQGDASNISWIVLFRKLQQSRNATTSLDVVMAFNRVALTKVQLLLNDFNAGRMKKAGSECDMTLCMVLQCLQAIADCYAQALCGLQRKEPEPSGETLNLRFGIFNFRPQDHQAFASHLLVMEIQSTINLSRQIGTVFQQLNGDPSVWGQAKDYLSQISLQLKALVAQSKQLGPAGEVL